MDHLEDQMVQAFLDQRQKTRVTLAFKVLNEYSFLRKVKKLERLDCLRAQQFFL